jgi:hypothetical protein
MTETEVDYLDGEITVLEQEPTEIAELLAIDGLTQKQIVEETVSNCRYRSKHPRVYKKTSEALKELAPRAQKGTYKLKDGTERPIFVSHLEHCRALLKVNKTKVTETLSKFALEEPLYVRGPAVGGTGRINAKSLAAANNYFAEGTERVEAVAKMIEDLVPGCKVARDEDDAVTPETLARALMALTKHMEKQAAQKTEALLATATAETT